MIAFQDMHFYIPVLIRTWQAFQMARGLGVEVNQKGSCASQWLVQLFSLAHIHLRLVKIVETCEPTMVWR